MTGTGSRAQLPVGPGLGGWGWGEGLQEDPLDRRQMPPTFPAILTKIRQQGSVSSVSRGGGTTAVPNLHPTDEEERRLLSLVASRFPECSAAFRDPKRRWQTSALLT